MRTQTKETQATMNPEKALNILRKVHPNGHSRIDITEKSLKIAKQAKNK